MATVTQELTPKLKKVDNEGRVHVQWMKPGAQRASRVEVEGQVRLSGSWWAKTETGEKQGGFKTKRAAAEWIVAQVDPTADEQAKAAPPVKRKRGSTEYDFTAEDIIRERTEMQRSWKQVAQALPGLTTPGSARKAWSDLTGKPHTESVLNGRTSRSSGGEMVAGEPLTPIWPAEDLPKWSKATAEEWKKLKNEVEKRLRCPDCHGKGWIGTGSDRKRCHGGFVAHRIVKTTGIQGFEETIRVQRVHQWYRPTPKCPVPAVGFTNAENGGGHVWRITDFLN